jgi:predicted adenylyl cyclase CyaB
MIQNVEIKARCADADHIRNYIMSNGGVFKGTDHQRDTYFNVPHGRLKLRDGHIENALIHYTRSDQKSPKASSVLLYPTQDGQVLLELLERSLGVMAVVDKIREIYFIGNVKFHIDSVKGLGDFMEIEAIDTDGSHTMLELQQQCSHYFAAFAIREEDLLTGSYSDMIA